MNIRSSTRDTVKAVIGDLKAGNCLYTNNEFALRSEDSSKRITLLGAAFALYFFSTGFDFVAIAPGLSVSRIVAFMVLVVCLLNARSLRFELSLMGAVLFGLIGVGITPLLLADAPQMAINPFFSLEIILVITFLALSFSFTRRDIALCEAALVAASLILCVLMFVSPGYVSAEIVSDRVVVALGGSRQDPNEFCGYMIFAISLLTFTAITRSRWWNFLFVGLMFFCVLMTGSRGGCVANLVAFMFAVLFAFKQTNKRITWIAIGFVLFFLLLLSLDSVLSLLPPSVANRFTVAGLVGGTGSQRVTAWGGVLSSFGSSDLLHQAFGHGYGATREVTFNGLVAHNSFIEILYNFGIVGLVLYVSCIVLVIRRAVSLGASCRNSVNRRVLCSFAYAVGV